jgi:hypothetical protein
MDTNLRIDKLIVKPTSILQHNPPIRGLFNFFPHLLDMAFYYP